MIPVAEHALGFGAPDELVELLTTELADEVRRRIAEVLHLQACADADVPAMREYVQAMLGLEGWAYSLQQAIHARPREHAHSVAA